MKKTYIVPEIFTYEIKMQSMLALSKTEEESDGSGALAPKMELDFSTTEGEDANNPGSYWK